MIPVFSASVDEDTTIHYDKTALFNDYIRTLRGKRVNVTIRKWKCTRSNNQNNYYFGVVCKVLGDYFGYTEEEMHDALKYKFLRKGACDIETVQSTTKLNTAEFEEYLENVRRWAAIEYNVIVPLPNEVEV